MGLILRLPKMVRAYINKRLDQKPSDITVRTALTKVLSGISSIRSAAKEYGFKKSTLAFYKSKHTLNSLMSAKSIIPTQHHSQIFSKKQEEEFSEYLKSSCLLNHGLTTVETQKLAQVYAEKNNINTPATWISKNIASTDWLTGFLKRNATLSIRKPEATSQARAAGFNEPVVSLFYDNLHSVYVKYNFEPRQIWNCDETNG